MSDSTTPARASGADLARQALAAYKVTAKTTPATGPKKTRRTMRPTRGEGRDPQRFGSLLTKVTAEQGWADQLGGGDILARWTDLCPSTYASTTRPTGYDPDTGTLTIQTASHTVATGLRMADKLLAKTINDKLGRPVVRQIRVTIGSDRTDNQNVQEQASVPGPEPEAPIRTRADGCPGYQDARAIVLEHRPERPPADPYVEEAMRRQEAALRAGRPPETEHRDAVWAQDDAERKAGPAPGSMAASEAAARAVVRQQRAARAPRRAFDVS